MATLVRATRNGHFKPFHSVNWHFLRLFSHCVQGPKIKCCTINTLVVFMTQSSSSSSSARAAVIKGSSCVNSPSKPYCFKCNFSVSKVDDDAEPENRGGSKGGLKPSRFCTFAFAVWQKKILQDCMYQNALFSRQQQRERCNC